MRAPTPVLARLARHGVTLAIAALAIAALGCGKRPPDPVPTRPAHDHPAPGETRSAPPAPIDGSAAWTASLGPGGGVRLRWRGVDLVRMEYPFHGADWAWANPTVSEGEAADGRARFTIDVPGFHTRIDAVAEPAEPGVLQVRYTMHVQQDLAGVIGGGPELHLRPEVLRGRDGYAAPELLPDRAGVRWAVGEGEVVTVRFDPAPPRLFFEQGRPEQIRAHLLGPDTKAGTHTITMRIELPPDGAVQPSLAERYAAGEGPWFPATFDWDHTPIDLRRLNDGHRPAGVHGPIEVRGDRLVFADGTPARLWGTNVVAYSLYSADRETIAAQARRIAALGFNLVRIHHHDSHWVDPNVFVAGADDTERLSDDALAKLDWWVKCLQDEGVYVWLDLHVGRHLRPGDDVPGYEELATHDGELKGFNYVNPRIEALMQGFARRYLGRSNRYTGRRYADDPGVVGILVTNENDITHHFGNLMNEGAGAPKHRKLLRALVEPFAKAHGIPVDAAMQPWAHGPAKVVMNELEARFHLRARERLRSLGVRAPIATTSFWGDDPMVSLPALTVGDVLDVHSYDGEGSLDVDPRADHNFIHRIAAGRVEGMPLTITEWNLLPPVRDRFVGPLWLAAVASLQGWEAPMHYCYTATPLPPPDQLYEGMGLIDPATVALMPAAALAYREGHVEPARRRYRVVLDRSQLYEREMGAHESAAIRTLAEQSRLEIALPDLPELDWDGPRTAGKGSRTAKKKAKGRAPAEDRPAATEVRDLDRSFLAPDATAVVSDTGQIRRDWTTGVGTLDTPKSQAAYGWIGGRTLALQDVTLEIDTPKATVVVTALDGLPIHRSKELLVSVAAQVDSEGGKPPLRAQAVTGRLSIRSEHERLVMRPITTGSRAAAPHAGVQQAGRREGDAHAFTLPALPTHWFRITPK